MGDGVDVAPETRDEAMELKGLVRAMLDRLDQPLAVDQPLVLKRGVPGSSICPGRTGTNSPVASAWALAGVGSEVMAGNATAAASPKAATAAPMAMRFMSATVCWEPRR